MQKGQLCRFMCKSFHAKDYFQCYKINRCHNPRNRERLQISKERYGECRERGVIEYDTVLTHIGVVIDDIIHKLTAMQRKHYYILFTYILKMHDTMYICIQ